MKLFAVCATALCALAVSAGAVAGGWATAGLAPPPEGTAAGDVWNAEVTILQHGRTPLAGVKPTITIRHAKTGVAKTFRAVPTKEPGVYRARAVFPSAGQWKYEVYDGFETYGGARTHRFPAVGIRTQSAPGPSAATRGERPSLLAWLLLAAAGLLLMTAVVLGTRRMRTTGAA